MPDIPADFLQDIDGWRSGHLHVVQRAPGKQWRIGFYVSLEAHPEEGAALASAWSLAASRPGHESCIVQPLAAHFTVWWAESAQRSVYINERPAAPYATYPNQPSEELVTMNGEPQQLLSDALCPPQERNDIALILLRGFAGAKMAKELTAEEAVTKAYEWADAFIARGRSGG